MAVDTKNPMRYHDLAKWFQKKEISEVYSDFEGMASGSGLDKAADDAITDRLGNMPEEKEFRQLMKDLLIHLMYEDRDQADQEPDHNRTLTMLDTLVRIFGARYYLRADAK